VQRGEGGEESDDGGEGDARGRAGGKVEGARARSSKRESECAQRGEDGEGGPFEVRGRDGEVRDWARLVMCRMACTQEGVSGRRTRDCRRGKGGKTGRVEAGADAGWAGEREVLYIGRSGEDGAQQGR
jgi:hypothetical protein